MNDTEFDLVARDWLANGPSRLPDHALLSALQQISTTRQRRARWPERRGTPLSIVARAAIAAILVAAVGLLAATVVPRRSDLDGVGGPPTPTPTASPTATPSRFPSVGPLAFPNLTSTFVSPINGFSMKFFDRGVGTLAPARRLWVPNVEETDKAFDLVETGYAAMFKGASTEIPNEVSIDEWVDRSVVIDHADCHPLSRSRQAEISIDGQPARISECPGDLGEITATVIAGGRLYQFTLLHSRADGRAVFDAFAATIDLRPEDARVPSSLPSS